MTLALWGGLLAWVALPVAAHGQDAEGDEPPLEQADTADEAGEDTADGDPADEDPTGDGGEADEPVPEPPPTAAAVHPAAGVPVGQVDESGELVRRALPVYDGRPDPGPDTVDALLWIPRILTSPLYLISEYVIRQPLAALITAMEESGFFEALFDVFVFGPERNIAVFPTMFYDFGLSPSVGIYAYWDDFLGEGNRISINAATWGDDWLSLVAADSWDVRDDVTVKARFAAIRRPDQQFGGLGFDATQSPTTRYGVEQIDGSLEMTYDPWRRSQLGIDLAYLSAGFVDEPWGEDMSIGQRYQRVVRPPGFDTGYSALRLGARVAIDSRDESELSVGGIRGVAHAAQYLGFGGLPISRWVRWGGELHLMTDVLEQGRVLAIRGFVSMVHPVEGTVVPFTELPELGGNNGPLPGFQVGIIRGWSLASVVVDYQWPVWAFLDATLHFGVGNAFDVEFQDFEFERLRMSFGVGLAPRVAGEHFFEMGFAFGSETFARGADITSVRFFVGTRNAL